MAKNFQSMKIWSSFVARTLHHGSMEIHQKLVDMTSTMILHNDIGIRNRRLNKKILVGRGRKPINLEEIQNYEDDDTSNNGEFNNSPQLNSCYPKQDVHSNGVQDRACNNAKRPAPPIKDSHKRGRGDYNDVLAELAEISRQRLQLSKEIF